jgi:hypothetical protein
MADFLYLFWNKDGKMPIDHVSPEEMQKMMQKWMGWMETLKKSGHLKDGGAPLEMTGKTVQGPRKSVVDGPYPEAKDAIGGFIIVTAKDIDEAAELSKGCPILESEGMVEVRPVREMLK